MENAITDSNAGGEAVEQVSDLHAEMERNIVQENLDNGVNTAEEPKSWADGKYKSVDELENGYVNLQRKFHEKVGDHHGSPESGYTLLDSEGETANNIDTSNLGFQKFVKLAEANNISQDGFDKYMECMQDYFSEQAGKASQSSEQSHEDTLNEHVKELGGWSAVEGTANQIASSLSNQGLKDEQINSLIGSVTDAAGFTALQALADNSSYSKIPGDSNSGGIINNEVLMDRMRKTESMHPTEREEYQKETTRMFEAAYPGYKETS